MVWFWRTAAAIEISVWVLVLPYLLYKQWGWIPAVALPAWWIFYCGCAYYANRKAENELIERLLEAPLYPEEEDVEDLSTEQAPHIDPDDDDIHRWIDGGGCH